MEGITRNNPPTQNGKVEPSPQGGENAPPSGGAADPSGTSGSSGFAGSSGFTGKAAGGAGRAASGNSSGKISGEADGETAGKAANNANSIGFNAMQGVLERHEAISNRVKNRN